MVPEGFRLSTGTVKHLWDFYYFGDITRRIQPLKLLHRRDLSVSGDKTNLTRVKAVMDKLEAIARNNNKPEHGSKIESLTKAASNSICDYTFNMLVDELYPSKRPRRYENLQYSYLYELLLKLV